MLPTLAQLESLFTTPALAALGAAAVSVPIAIHLLSRLRRRRQPWGAMRFLLAAIQAHRRRLRFEQWLLLALRCLIVALLGIALAGPILTGCASQRGRVVYLLIDDSLATRADAAPDATRFDRLRATAGQLLDGLSAGDRVHLWRLARPAAPRTAEPTLNHAEARQALAAMGPRYARSDLGAALRAVAGQLDAQGSRPDEAVMVLLSDFSAGTAASGGLADEHALRRLARRAKLLVARPMAGQSNVQIARLEPRRALVVAETADRATVPVTLEAMRFGDLSLAASAQAAIELLDDRGRTLAQAQRRIVWATGQRRAAVNVDLSAEAPAADRSLTVRARLDADAQLNALREDDTAWAVASVRRQLVVAVVGQEDDPSAGLTPTRWLTLALAPTTGSPVALQTIAPMNLADLDALDACVVLRPDRLGEPAWQALATFARRGGLVWVWPAPDGEAASWVAVMARVFEMRDWSINWQPQDSQEGWPVEAATTPPPLRMLGADYEAMLRPVRVWRRLSIEAPPDDTWVALASTGDALIASKPVGLGQVVLSAAALDVAWTNLPAKPIFVPLVHETLRGVLGAQRGRVTQAVAGDRPSLGPDFVGASRLVPVTGGVEPVSLVRDAEDQTLPAQALEAPGVFAAEGDAALKLAVNVDAAAGDLSALDEQRLAQWLSPAGSWQWLSPGDAAGALLRPVNVMRLGWPLLWAVAGLIVLETMLARWLSHAGAAPGDSLSHRLLARLASLRHEPTERRRAA